MAIGAGAPDARVLALAAFHVSLNVFEAKVLLRQVLPFCFEIVPFDARPEEVAVIGFLPDADVEFLCGGLKGEEEDAAATGQLVNFVFHCR
ncbi:MAG: hypothetical protein IPM82_28155 [Saprospiraceae bacterium]|nr:hypothetical protein [Saprospiraceae bacterium]